MTLDKRTMPLHPALVIGAVVGVAFVLYSEREAIIKIFETRHAQGMGLGDSFDEGAEHVRKRVSTYLHRLGDSIDPKIEEGNVGNLMDFADCTSTDGCKQESLAERGPVATSRDVHVSDAHRRVALAPSNIDITTLYDENAPTEHETDYWSDDQMNTWADGVCSKNSTSSSDGYSNIKTPSAGSDISSYSVASRHLS